MLNPLLWLVLKILEIYTYVVLASVILSWLVSFNIINGHSPFVRQVGYFLDRLTEPVLRPIRRILPDLGPIDISPVILLFGIQFLQYFIVYYAQVLL